MNLGTRVDGEPFRVCSQAHCAAPKHIENCFSCAGFGHLILEEQTALPVTVAMAVEGQVSYKGAQLVFDPEAKLEPRCPTSRTR